MPLSSASSSPPRGGAEGDLYNITPDPTARTHRLANHAHSLSPSPSASFSSDKENHDASRQERAKSKGKMAPPNLPTPVSETSSALRMGKRRRVDDGYSQALATQLAHERELDEVVDTQFYDPDQDVEERRDVRKGLRDLSRDLRDSGAEYLNPESNGLLNTIRKANEIYSKVKQTSDATIDSRLLVTTAELSKKKANQLSLGNVTLGIDVDEFVTNCISFMRHGAAMESGRPHRARARQSRVGAAGGAVDASGGEESDFDEGDALDWAYLGTHACLQHNLRPPLPGFLLGPLSLQKRARQQRGPRTGLNARNAPETRPKELDQADLQKNENADLTRQCTKIRQRLAQTQAKLEETVGQEISEDMSESQQKAVMFKHGICDDGGLNFFRFVINPDSFSQTVENLFYVSFLIRDGSAGVATDSAGIPSLHSSQPRSKAQIKEQSVEKHQAVFAIDVSTWSELKDIFNISKPMIPHRTGEEGEGGGAPAARQVGTAGWY
ncbi:MAG: nuclear protein [Trizodia sp. TS-e1964]|nr:MAG: nuclear protein [Trizodia sp. TS-e1964]